MTKPLSAPDDGCTAPPIRLFLPPRPDPLPPGRTYFDFDRDRHHVAVIPLDRRKDALAMIRLGWTVQKCPLWYLCSRTEEGGADAARD